MINELKSKTRQVKETRLLKQDEVYNGALEDILLGKDMKIFDLWTSVFVGSRDINIQRIVFFSGHYVFISNFSIIFHI